MIYQMARDVTAGLVSRGFPVDVRYYDTEIQAGALGLRITFGRDARGGDPVGALVGAPRNPKGAWSRKLGVVVVLHVASGLSGAMRAEHEHECDDLVDGLLTELAAWCSDGQAMVPEIIEAGYVPQDEVALANEVFGMPAHPAPVEGVTYVLRFRISRGVTRRTYAGSALTVVDAGDYTIDTPNERVALPGGEWEIVEEAEE